MEKTIILTKDGSHTVSIPGLNVTYHSHHGAIQESMHVFINAGLALALEQQRPVTNVLEMGLGTGLNALLTLIEAERSGTHIHYTAIEKYPLAEREVQQLNYCARLNREDLVPVFEKIHTSEWGESIALSKHFTLEKIATDLTGFNPKHKRPYHLVYFDAFAPAAQPELWTKDIFEKLFQGLEPRGALVTYCSKSIVRAAMQSAGFKVEKLPGPPGKREMVRATRP